jgi:exopolyphosphatase/pppGpp-phosphohydrolase
MYTLAQLERVNNSSLDGDDEELTEADRFAALRMLLEPLDRFRMDPELHPEGDALYHSLQVFELGRAERPYDEEFLLACLLHDVGLGIDPKHATRAAVEALEGLVTERTLFLIENRLAATRYLQTGEIPRAVRKSENFEELLLLARCNRAGCVAGAPVCSLDEALDYLAGLESAWDEER